MSKYFKSHQSSTITTFIVMFMASFSVLRMSWAANNVPTVGVSVSIEEVICLNDDDDDKNEEWDFIDAGVTGEDDLTEVSVSAAPDEGGGTLTLTVVQSGKVKFFKDAAGAEPYDVSSGLTWTVTKDGDEFIYSPSESEQPRVFYVEGIAESASVGDVKLTAKYVEASAEDEEEKKSTVLKIDADVDSLNGGGGLDIFGGIVHDDNTDKMEDSKAMTVPVLDDGEDADGDGTIDIDDDLVKGEIVYNEIIIRKPSADLVDIDSVKFTLDFTHGLVDIFDNGAVTPGFRVFIAELSDIQYGYDHTLEYIPGNEFTWTELVEKGCAVGGENDCAIVYVQAISDEVEEDEFVLTVTGKLSGEGGEEFECKDTFLVSSKFGDEELPENTLTINPEEAVGPKYRKIGLNGRPLSDEKPQSASESDEEREQTYIDALTRSFSHSTTDIYIPVPSSDLSLSVRRNSTSKIWNSAGGSTPDEDPSLVFGPAWSSNLCSYIQIDEQVVKSTGALVAGLSLDARKTEKVSQSSPNTATVVDENGSSHRFIIEYNGSNPIFTPMPSGRHHQQSYLATLEKQGSSYVFTKLFGTQLTFTTQNKQPVLQDSNRQIVAPKQQTRSTFYNLDTIKDRFEVANAGKGAQIDYTYNTTDSLIPSSISVEGRTELSLTIVSSGGKVQSITDGRNEAVTYSYTSQVTLTSVGGLNYSAGTANYDVLSQVTRAEGSVSEYGYIANEEFDTADQDLWAIDRSVENTSPKYERRAFHINLKSVADAYGNTTEVDYEHDGKLFKYLSQSTFDDSGKKLGKFTGHVKILGQAMVVTTVKRPNPTGSGTPLSWSLTGTHRVALTPDGTALDASSQRTTTVTDLVGNSYTYVWNSGDVQVMPEALATYMDPHDGRNFDVARIVYYPQQMTSYAGGGSETYNFDVDAGMSVSSINDLSGNVTSFVYGDPIPLTRRAYGDLSGFFAKFPEPTTQTNAEGDARLYAYDDAYRTMTSITDEEGRVTLYELDGGIPGGLGLRTKKTVTAAGAAQPILIETYEYGDARYAQFLTKTTIKSSGTVNSSNDPTWVKDIVTINVKDTNGRVKDTGVDMNEDGLLDRSGSDLVTSYTYDANGNKLTVKDSKGYDTTFTYDGENRITEVKYHDLTTQDTTYDKRGLKVMTGDENNHRVAYEYDALSRLVKTVVDMDGNLSVVVSATGVAYSGTADATDLASEIVYNDVNSPVRSIDPRGFITRTDYDYLQRPTKIYAPGPHRTAGQIPDNSDPNNPDYVTTMFYDGPNIGSTAFNSSGLRATSILDPRGYETTFKYDSLYRLTEKYTQYEATTSGYIGEVNTYDKVGNLRFKKSLLSPVDSAGGSSTASDFLTSETRYDALNRPTWSSRVESSASASLDGYTETKYTSTGFAHQSIQQLATSDLRTTDSEYDLAGRLVKVYAPTVFDTVSNGNARPLTETFYDANSNVSYTINPLGNRWDYSYDVRNRKTQEQAPAVYDTDSQTSTRPTTATVYDNVGNVVKVTDPRGSSSVTFYDAANRPTASRVNPTTGAPSETLATIGTDDITTTSFYDKNGNVTSLTDGNGNITRNAYDPLNRLIKTATNPTTGNPVDPTDPATNPPHADDVVVQNTYDESNNLITVTDGEGAVTGFTYDGLNRKTATIWDQGATLEKTDQILTYTGANLTKRTDAKGQVTNYTYDDYNRLSYVEYVGRTQDNRSNTYDLADRLLIVTYPNETTSGQTLRDCTSTYDDLDRVKTEISAGQTHSYFYDLAGNRTKTVYGGTGREMASVYDDLNRLNTCTEKDSATATSSRVTSYAYDLAGNITRKDLPNGSYTTCSFDKLGRKLDLITLDSSDAVISSFDYSPASLTYPSGYDNVGNVLTIIERYPTSGSISASDRNVYNTYDKTYRLAVENVATQDSPSQRSLKATYYDYDKANNMSLKVTPSPVISVGGSPISIDGYGSHVAFTSNSSRRVYNPNPSGPVAVTPNTLTYYVGNGENGYNSNQIAEIGGTLYTYDANGNRATKAVSGTSTQTYGYDYDNRLVEVVEPAISDSHTYAYDHRTRRVLRDESSAYGVSGVKTTISFSGGTSVQEYEGSNTTPSVEYVRGSDYGGGIGGVLYTLRSGVPSYNSYNSRGDVVSKTDDLGVVTWQSTYEAFGTRTEENGSTSDRQKANTKDEDPTGLLNEGMRYRDLETGLFLTRDPAGFVDGPNVYTYVRQNPWTMFDPLGLEAEFQDNVHLAKWRAMAKDENQGFFTRVGASFMAAGEGLNPFRSDSNLRQGGRRFNKNAEVARQKLKDAPPVIREVAQFTMGVGMAGAAPLTMSAGLGEVGDSIQQNGVIATGDAIVQGAIEHAKDNPLEFMGEMMVPSVVLKGKLDASPSGPSPKDVAVTSWADVGVKPDLKPGRWVMKGKKTRLNYLLTGLSGPKVYFTKKFPYFRVEKSKSNYNNSKTGEVPASSLERPGGLDNLKLGQRKIKKEKGASE